MQETPKPAPEQTAVKIWPDRLTYIEADEYLGARSKTGAFTRALVKRKLIRCIEMGYKTIRIPKSELDRFLRSRQTSAITQ